MQFHVSSGDLCSSTFPLWTTGEPDPPSPHGFPRDEAFHQRNWNHPWVRKWEITISTKIDSDFKIIYMLCYMRYNASQILNSCTKEIWCTNGCIFNIKRTCTPRAWAWISLFSQGCGSLPYMIPIPNTYSSPKEKGQWTKLWCLLRIRPSGEQGPVPLAQSGHKLARSVSLPPIAQHYPCKQRRASSSAPHSTEVAGPCVCNNILEIEILPPTSQDSDMEISSPCKKIGQVKKLCRRSWSLISRP